MKVHEYGSQNADIVLIQPVDEHDLAFIENEIRRIAESTGVEFRLFAVEIEDWNRDLSPWEAPAVFGKEGFGNGAANTLAEITALCSDNSKTYYIGCYSLAGLFALWTAYQTDLFQGVASASPSVWFPGFVDYMRNNIIGSNTVYLSLGDKEEKTRNPVMATVGVRIREAHDLLKEQGINTTLEWNPGNHFKDADIRTAKAFSWILSGN
ncbi:MAG: esterase [Mogibacterium sp.]|nr:esterase [Mogibacterium sp.]